MKYVISAFKLYFEYGRIPAKIHFLLYILDVGTTLLQLYSLKWFINAVSLYGQNNTNIFGWLLLLFSVYIISYFIKYFMAIVSQKCDITFSKNFSFTVFNKLKRLKYSNYEDSCSNDVFSRIGSDSESEIKKAVFSCINLMKIIISTTISAIILFETSLTTALSFFIIIVLASIFSIQGISKLNELKKEQTKDERKLNYFNGLLVDKSSVLELRIFNAIKYITNKINTINNNLVKSLIKKSFEASSLYNVSTIVITIWTIFAIYQCYNSVVASALTIGGFAIVLKIIISLMSSIEEISYAFADISSELQIIRFYRDFMNLSETKKVKFEQKSRLEDDEVISLNNVSFKYPGSENNVLENINISIKRNEKIAIVGENGSGKSTLVKLMCGLFEPTIGEVISNENDISAVFQDYCKYFLTLRENVAIGDVSKLECDEEINNALEASEFEIDELSLDSSLGKLNKEGVDISGGQWQRLAIARAMISKKNILLLDEPTASIDPIAEKELYDSFMSASKNKTCIIISHRLASARIADRILVLKDKNIIEDGSHDELMKKKGLYYKMFEAQSSWYLKENDDA